MLSRGREMVPGSNDTSAIVIDPIELRGLMPLAHLLAKLLVTDGQTHDSATDVMQNISLEIGVRFVERIGGSHFS